MGRMFGVRGTSYRFLVTNVGAGRDSAPHFALQSPRGVPHAWEVFPAFRRLANLHGISQAGNGSSRYVAKLVCIQSAFDWRLSDDQESWRETRSGPVLVRRERQVASLYLSGGGRLTHGFSGLIAETLLLMEAAGLDDLTRGWEGVELDAEDLQLKTAPRPAHGRTAGWPDLFTTGPI